MSNPEDDDLPRSYASPPCFMHELDPDYLGHAHLRDVRQKKDVRRWRVAERNKLIAERLTILAQDHVGASRKIAYALNTIIGDPAGLTIGIYWPMRGEPDLRFWVTELVNDGAHFALPVVVAKNQPLTFQGWSPGSPLQSGTMNIPIPTTGDKVHPDIIIAPVVGFDPQCFRLGYGGGYYDRTLAALSPKPRTIGVGFKCTQITTIYPQPHDIAMDMVITETGITHPAAE